MGIKSIVCIFDGSQDELCAAGYALELAKIFAAHVKFLHISNDPKNYIVVYEGGLTSSLELVESIEQENEVRLKKALSQIKLLTEKYNIPLDKKEFFDHHASAQFINKTGYPDTIIASEGIASDLIVIGHYAKTKDIIYTDNLISAIYNTGRPVLFLPIQHKIAENTWSDEVVSIAWDGTLESARAIYNAMPLLERAEKLYILTAHKTGKMEDSNLHNPIMEYLNAHGLKPDHIILDSGKLSFAETIFNKAKDLDSNLLIMGAYGHNRFREIILGGFTKYMLEKSDIPLLLSH